MTTFTRFLTAIIQRLPLSDVFSNWIDYDFMPFKIFFYFCVIGFSLYLFRRVVFE